MRKSWWPRNGPAFSRRPSRAVSWRWLRNLDAAAQQVVEFAATRPIDAIVGVDDATAVLAAALWAALSLPPNSMAAVASRTAAGNAQALTSSGDTKMNQITPQELRARLDRRDPIVILDVPQDWERLDPAGGMRIEAREGASHGSPERVPGAISRALAVLYLRGHPDVSRVALARELRRRLAPGGIHYHLRTLRRQLSGAVSTVPPEVETAMRQILRERDGLAREEELERALAASGIEIPHGDRASALVVVERILPLVQLWLHLNPGKSKRFLAARLANDLGRNGCRSTIDALQRALAGRRRHVRRVVHCVLLARLAELGVTSEEEARLRARELQQDIRRSSRRRAFVDACRFRQLCRLWQVLRHEPATRRFAVLLKERLGGWGLSAHVKHLQTIINGDSPCVRGAFLEAVEEVLREEVRDLRNAGSPRLWAATPD